MGKKYSVDERWLDVVKHIKELIEKKAKHAQQDLHGKTTSSWSATVVMIFLNFPVVMSVEGFAQTSSSSGAT